MNPDEEHADPPTAELSGLPVDGDPTGRLLRDVLMREAGRVTPSGDGLQRIRETLDSSRGRAGGHQPGRHPRRPAWLPLAAAAAAVAVLGGVGTLSLRDRDVDPAAGRGGPTPTTVAGQSPNPGPSTAPVPSASPSASPSESPSGSAGPSPSAAGSRMPVYWLGATKSRIWLYREWVPTSGYSMEIAVAAMLGASLPRDPDLSTPWRPASVLVQRADDLITVDLGAAAFSGPGVGSEVAAVAVQQLVYTVTAAANANLPVRILVDGRAGHDAWGAVRLGEPMRRDPEVAAPVWVVEPQHGQIVPAGPLVLKGYGHGLEATLLWEVADSAGRVVRRGTAQGGANGRPSEFEVPVTLPAGTYTVTMYAPDPSGGESPEGPRPYPDTKTFTVR